jgi:hypothetical protein
VVAVQRKAGTLVAGPVLAGISMAEDPEEP